MDNQLPSPNLPSSPEASAGNTPENLPSPEAAAASGVGPTPAPALSAADVAAAIAATPTVGAPQIAPLPATPLMAGDVDVIEPEWVDKAEAVVREHRGDPYAEEEAIQTLQEEYLQKRYGISVAEPDADNTKPKGT